MPRTLRLDFDMAWPPVVTSARPTMVELQLSGTHDSVSLPLEPGAAEGYLAAETPVGLAILGGSHGLSWQPLQPVLRHCRRFDASVRVDERASSVLSVLLADPRNKEVLVADRDSHAGSPGGTSGQVAAAALPVLPALACQEMHGLMWRMMCEALPDDEVVPLCADTFQSPFSLLPIKLQHAMQHAWSSQFRLLAADMQYCMECVPKPDSPSCASPAPWQPSSHSSLAPCQPSSLHQSSLAPCQPPSLAQYQSSLSPCQPSAQYQSSLAQYQSVLAPLVGFLRDHDCHVTLVTLLTQCVQGGLNIITPPRPSPVVSRPELALVELDLVEAAAQQYLVEAAARQYTYLSAAGKEEAAGRQYAYLSASSQEEGLVVGASGRQYTYVSSPVTQAEGFVREAAGQYACWGDAEGQQYVHLSPTNATEGLVVMAAGQQVQLVQLEQLFPEAAAVLSAAAVVTDETTPVIITAQHTPCQQPGCDRCCDKCLACAAAADSCTAAPFNSVHLRPASQEVEHTVTGGSAASEQHSSTASEQRSGTGSEQRSSTASEQRSKHKLRVDDLCRALLLAAHAALAVLLAWPSSLQARPQHVMHVALAALPLLPAAIGHLHRGLTVPSHSSSTASHSSPTLLSRLLPVSLGMLVWQLVWLLLAAAALLTSAGGSFPHGGLFSRGPHGPHGGLTSGPLLSEVAAGMWSLCLDAAPHAASWLIMVLHALVLLAIPRHSSFASALTLLVYIVCFGCVDPHSVLLPACVTVSLVLSVTWLAQQRALPLMRVRRGMACAP